MTLTFSQKGDEIRHVVLTLNKLEQELEEEEKRHDGVVKQIKEKIAKLQETCSHPFHDYWPDASGNNDDTTKCSLCRKYLD